MEDDLPPEAANGIMHAHLDISSGAINGSDNLSPYPVPAMAGCNVMVIFTDADTACAHFDKQSEGRDVRMPFKAEFWSPGFGAFTDRFSIRWMIDTSATPA